MASLPGNEDIEQEQQEITEALPFTHSKVEGLEYGSLGKTSGKGVFFFLEWQQFNFLASSLMIGGLR